jgi:hypothetical protein
MNLSKMAPGRLLSTVTSWSQHHGLASKMIVRGGGDLPDENIVEPVRGGVGRCFIYESPPKLYYVDLSLYLTFNQLCTTWTSECTDAHKSQFRDEN